MDTDLDPASRAAALHEQAIVLREGGRFVEAEAACQEAVSSFEAAEGADSPNLANAMVEHARLLEILDRLDEAGPVIEKALGILRPLVAEGHDREGQHDGSRDEEQATIDEELVRLLVHAEAARASILRCRGLLGEAEAGCRHALALAESRLSADDPLVAEMLNGLGVVHKFQGRYDEAEPLYRRALAIAQAAGMEGDAATLYHNLGGLAHARGDFATGEPLARRSVEMREAQLGADHPTTAADRAAWGALLEGLGRAAEAERAYAEALAVFETSLGPRSLEVASALTALGAVQHTRGALAEAERSYRRSLDIREALLGPHHFDLALTLNNLAMLLLDRDRRAEALSLLDRSRTIFAVALGPNHPHTKAARENLAAIGAAPAH